MSELTDNMPTTGRKLEMIASLHTLSLDQFAGSTVVDLGCGKSDLGKDLEQAGIDANVIGVDQNQNALVSSVSIGQMAGICARLGKLPLRSRSADLVLATYSLPFWARNPLEIHQFFSEAQRIVKIGGLLSVYPTTVSRSNKDIADMVIRETAVYREMRQLKRNSNWTSVNTSFDTLTIKRVS